jgi:hypothetical protein
MRASLPTATNSAALAATGALFLAGFVYDLRTLQNDLANQHRLMACIGMYELKSNLSSENPRTICERAVAALAMADLE